MTGFCLIIYLDQKLATMVTPRQTSLICGVFLIVTVSSLIFFIMSMLIQQKTPQWLTSFDHIMHQHTHHRRYQRITCNKIVSYPYNKTWPNTSSKHYNLTYYQTWYGSSLKQYYNHSNICNKCYLPNILMMCAHKTGGYLSQWREIFIDECEFRAKRRYRRAKETIVWSQYNAWSDVTTFFQTFPRSHAHLILFSVRHPLQTILSGYNYHATFGNEPWISQMNHKPPGAYDKPLKFCFKDIFEENKNVLLINETDSMYSAYTGSYSFKQSGVDSNRDIALQHGLYLELHRYANCEYPFTYKVYSYFKKAMEKYNVLFVRFEWFHDYNYIESIHYLLDAMQVDPDIYQYKTNLLHRLVQLNGAVGAHNKHSTKGKYDHALQTKLLLTSGKDKLVCLYIKKMSLQLDYPWEYNMFC
eukprot:430930_1